MNRKVFVGNLPWSVGYEELKKLFNSYGEIEDAVVMADKDRRKSKGFGFVTFKDESSAQKAIAEMNGKDIEGREINVSIAKPSKTDK